MPVPADRLQVFSQQLGAYADVIHDTQHAHDELMAVATRQDIINLLKRRPCSLDDIAHGLHMHPNEVIKHLEYLHAHQCVTLASCDGQRFYAMPQHVCLDTADETG
jgi:predicted ArsR family transcriptional regulator